MVLTGKKPSNGLKYLSNTTEEYVVALVVGIIGALNDKLEVYKPPVPRKWMGKYQGVWEDSNSEQLSKVVIENWNVSVEDGKANNGIFWMLAVLVL